MSILYCDSCGKYFDSDSLEYEGSFKEGTAILTITCENCLCGSED